MRIAEFKTKTFGTTDLTIIEESFRKIQDIIGLMSIKGLSVKVSKKYVIIADASERSTKLGYTKRTLTGTDKLETAIKKLKEYTESSVWGSKHPEIITK